MKKTAYSIWLMPHGQLFKTLHERIANLSLMFGGPIFEPHVTLINNLRGDESDIIAKTHELAEVVHRYELILLNPDYFNEFYKCVFLKVANNHEVAHANSRAREIFNHLNDPPYDPHLSMLYGELPVEMKKEIVAKLTPLEVETFVVSNIHLVAVGGNCSEWYHVDSFPLSKQPMHQRARVPGQHM